MPSIIIRFPGKRKYLHSKPMIVTFSIALKTSVSSEQVFLGYFFCESGLLLDETAIELFPLKFIDLSIGNAQPKAQLFPVVRCQPPLFRNFLSNNLFKVISESFGLI